MADSEQILRNVLVKIADEQKYEDPKFKIDKVSTEGANFSSFLFEVTVSAEHKDDLNLFAKVAAAGETLRAQAPIKMYEVEAYFYTVLLPRYRKLEEEHNIEEKHRLVVPKLYASHSTLYEETIVLENLTKNGFTTLDRVEIVSWEYASTAFTELAKLHALSFALAEDSPEEYQEMFKTLKFEWFGDSSAVEKMFESAIAKAVAVAKEEYKPKLMQFVSNFNMEMMMKYFTPDSNKFVVFRHGDFRASNLMHKHNEDGSLTVIPVDYQTIQPGDPLIDLFYMIFTGTDDQFRAKYWQKLLDHYYAELCAAMRRLGVDPQLKYSRESFDESVKETMPYGLITALTILPLVTVDVAPEVSKEVDMECFMNMKMGNLYGERLNGILKDYIQWGCL